MSVCLCVCVCVCGGGGGGEGGSKLLQTDGASSNQLLFFLVYFTTGPFYHVCAIGLIVAFMGIFYLTLLTENIPLEVSF